MSDVRKSDQDLPISIFLSYASEDRESAELVVSALEKAGCNVWWDRLIAGGEVYAHTIEQALTDASVVVVLWSANSINSHWVRDEAAHGRDHSCLVPVSLDGSVSPLGFRQFQLINLHTGSGKVKATALSAIVDAVAAADRSPTMPLASDEPATSVQTSRRRLLVAGGLAGVATIAAGGWIAWREGLIPAARAAINSIVVLPFTNLDRDPDREYFVDGLAAEVRAALARNNNLRVIAGVSSEVFRDSSDDAVSIAQKLGVAFLLGGNVRLSGTTVRIAAELIDGRTGFSRWSRSFDRSIDDVFAVQNEVATSAVLALAKEMALTGDTDDGVDNSATHVGGTTSALAYDAYLRGRALFKLAESEDTDREALAQFDVAIVEDPDFAAAHAARSRALTIIGNYYAEAQDTPSIYDEAIAAAETATLLVPALADGHSALGVALSQGRLDMRAAQAPFQLSYELGRGDASVLGRYALFCALTGRQVDAEPAMARVLELDPLNPLAHRSMGIVLYNARRYAEVIPRVEQALAMNPKMGDAHAILGDALFQLGRNEEALKEYRAESYSLVSLPGIAMIEHKLGNGVAARVAMDQLLAEHGDFGLYQQAQVLAQWGEREAAMAILLRARELGDSGLMYARNDPMLDPIRQMPGFPALLNDLGFS